MTLLRPAVTAGDRGSKTITKFCFLPITEKIWDNFKLQTLHKLKYQPPLQKSGFAPQRKSFRTTWELERCFAAIGIPVDAVQITPGELSDTFDIYGSSSLPIFSLHTNQGLVVEGDRNP